LRYLKENSVVSRYCRTNPDTTAIIRCGHEVLYEYVWLKLHNFACRRFRGYDAFELPSNAMSETDDLVDKIFSAADAGKIHLPKNLRFTL
jgi:hypothetical protein